MVEIRYAYAVPNEAFREDVEPPRDTLRLFYQENREAVREAGIFYNFSDFLRVGFGLPSRLESL